MIIKVEQIYKEPHKYGIKYVITRKMPKTFSKRFQAICNDGYVFDNLFEVDIKNDTLIAKYPTWQEAVNSKEFNDG